MYLFDGWAGITGYGDVRETLEEGMTHIGWGPVEYNRAFIWPTVIAAATVDTGNDGTPVETAPGPATLLRPGLLMAFNTTTKKASAYLVGGGGGLAVMAGPLIYSVNMLQQGTAVDRMYGWILVGGNIKSSKLIYNEANAAPGGWVGGGNDATIRAALANRFILDDLFYPNA